VTFRPEFAPPWAGQPQVTMLMLDRLDRPDRTALVTQIAGGKRLPDGLVDQIIERTDGVPLFAEELTKSVLESGLLSEQRDCYVLDRALPVFAIPMTLHDSLMARLDRLTSVRRVAQIGAAIGREFSYSLLHAVSQVPEDELQASLARLIHSQLIFQRGTPPDAVYSFKHALVQDAVHGSLLRGPRQQLHAQITEALVTNTPELLDSQPELFAHHYAEAGLIEKSVTCYGMAGRRSAARSAMLEAAAQFQKALDQLPLLPDNPDRQRAELEIRSALGAVLQALKGHAAPETGDAYARARELWEQLGSPSEFLHVPFAQSVYHVFRCEIDRAQLLAVDLLRLSRERNDNAGLVLGHLAVGRNLLFAGRFGSSRSHFEEGLGVYDPILHPTLVHHHAGVYPQIASRALLAIALFCLGFPDHALAQSNAAIFEAESLADPPSLAASLGFGARLLSLVGEKASLNARVDLLVAVTTEQGFAVWHALGTIYRGWAKVINGDVAEGTSLLRTGSIAYRATGTEASVPYHMALLAAAYEIAGQVEESLAVLDDALQIAERTGERWVSAELYRRKGHLLLRQGHSAAERYYCRAMSIAEEQGAKLWELRAAVSLARLRRDLGRQAEARDLLAPLYNWFTEGFDTPDLKEAKALLDELG
jgi:predicted ATPase